MKNRTYKDLSIFAKRRALLRTLGEGDGILLFSGKESAWQRFRPMSNFVYYTGYEEAGSVALIRPGHEHEFVLFVSPKDPLKETWDGVLYGPDCAKDIFGCDLAFSIAEMNTKSVDLLKECKRLHFDYGDVDHRNTIFEIVSSVKSYNRRSGRGGLDLSDFSHTSGPQRLVKCDTEIEWMRESCEISAMAHLELMKRIEVGWSETTAQGVLLENFHGKGAPREGYFSIVGSGVNATILHYRDNNDVCKDGDLILVDAGAEKHYYTGDITRTFPVNGKFTPAQKELYTSVLSVQKKLIQRTKPGYSLNSMQEDACDLLADELIKLGFFSEEKSAVMEKKLYQKYYPHRIGHYLGMDVHDVGPMLDDKGVAVPFKEGIVITIEPGLYIPANDLSAPEKFRGQGVRIEDNILVTSLGCEVLSTSAPKEVHDIEEAMA